MSFRQAGLSLLLVPIILITSTLAICFFNGFCLYLPLLMVTNHKLYRRLADETIGHWIIFATALLELMLGIKVVITGDTIRSGERTLMIMNHRTRLDWLYMWSVLIRQSGVKTEKIILKSFLKHIPGAGWAMQCGAFIFIHRKWDVDKLILSKMIQYFASLKHRTQILLFPEGTDLTERTKARSDEYAEKNNLRKFDHVLHPRTTGFTYIATEMMQNGQLDCIYDITVAYPYNFPQNEPELFLGNAPREVHFHIKRHPMATLPTTEAGLQTWCQQVWEEKEARLSAFYQHKHFSESSEDTNLEPNNNQHSPLPILYCALIYWTLFCIGIILILIFSPMARILLVFQSAFYILTGWWYGGFEFLHIDIYNSLHKHKTT